MRSYAESRLANLPYALDLLFVDVETHRGGSGAAAQRLHQTTGLRFGLQRGFRAELNHQPSGAFRQQREAFGVDALRAGVSDEKIVETFEANRLVRHDLGHMVGALINVGIGDNEKYALARTFDQAAGCFENRYARSFRADERAGHVE